jgi:hypothetical protein
MISVATKKTTLALAVLALTLGLLPLTLARASGPTVLNVEGTTTTDTRVFYTCCGSVLCVIAPSSACGVRCTIVAARRGRSSRCDSADSSELVAQQSAPEDRCDQEARQVAPHR